jgi:hypothetical protein
MSVRRIWKEHRISRGPKKGQTELFIVTARASDGAYCLKMPDERSNTEQFYRKVYTLNDVATLTRQGWSVRMKSQVTGAWNTLKSEGLEYA